MQGEFCKRLNRAAVGYRLALGLRRELQRIARIKAGKVMKGMTREQVIMSVGYPLTQEPLAKLTLQGDFSLLWAKAGGAGGHFWHDTVTETNIITPAKWILPNAN